MYRKRNTMALAALLSAFAICTIGVGTSADEKTADKVDPNPKVANEFIGVWHADSGTGWFVIEIKPNGQALFVHGLGAWHEAHNFTWKRLPGGLLVYGIPRFRFWKGSNKSEARVETGPNEGEIKGFSTRILMQRMDETFELPKGFPKNYLERELPTGWSFATLPAEWDHLRRTVKPR